MFVLQQKSENNCARWARAIRHTTPADERGARAVRYAPDSQLPRRVKTSTRRCSRQHPPQQRQRRVLVLHVVFHRQTLLQTLQLRLGPAPGVTRRLTVQTWRDDLLVTRTLTSPAK